MHNIVLISAVQQSDSVIHTYVLFHVLFHNGLSQYIEWSSLCSTVGPCCVSILYMKAPFLWLHSVSVERTSWTSPLLFLVHGRVCIASWREAWPILLLRPLGAPPASFPGPVRGGDGGSQRQRAPGAGPRGAQAALPLHQRPACSPGIGARCPFAPHTISFREETRPRWERPRVPSGPWPLLSRVLVC